LASELHSEIEISAAVERVWNVLTDFASFPAWNPFIRRLAGGQTEGATLEVRLGPPGGRAMTFRPTVQRFEANREFGWLGHLGVAGLFDGEHRFSVEPLAEDKVRFTQHERFTGVLVPIIFPMVRDSTQRGFDGMNAALKERAEATDTSPP
jgi:hypothetical protein